jgi:hypothetical protein
MHVLRISTRAATGGRAPSGPIATVGEVCRGDTAVVGRRVSSGCPGLGDLVATFTVRTGCRCRCSAFRANGVEAPARERDEGTAGRTVVSGENRLGIAPEKRSGRMQCVSVQPWYYCKWDRRYSYYRCSCLRSLSYCRCLVATRNVSRGGVVLGA